MPKVSVVIPAYNGDRFIGEAIASVFNQTYQDWELIVIDDGSTDTTRQILEIYIDRIQYIYQTNQGSGAARNLGIEIAKGELIAFLDADDFFITPEKLEEQVNCFNKQQSLGSLHTGWQQIQQNKKTLINIEPWHQAPVLDLETWLTWKPVRTSTMMIRRHWLEYINGFDTELKQAQDVDLVLRLALAGCKADWLRKITVGYRQHEGNTTNNASQQAEYLLLVLDKFFSRADLPQHIYAKEKSIRYHTFVWIAWYQYHMGCVAKAPKYLELSLQYTPFLWTETILDWVKKFSNFCEVYDSELDINLLTETREWQQLIMRA